MLIHAGRLTLAGLDMPSAARAAIVLPLTDDTELREALSTAIDACLG
jgi:nitric oxide reductase NorQ protein